MVEPATKTEFKQGATEVMFGEDANEVVERRLGGESDVCHRVRVKKPQ